jgi:hypothetical protein
MTVGLCIAVCFPASKCGLAAANGGPALLERRAPPKLAIGEHTQN